MDSDSQFWQQKCCARSVPGTKGRAQVLDLIGGDGWTLNDAIFPDIAKRWPERSEAEFMPGETAGFTWLTTDPGIMSAILGL